MNEIEKRIMSHVAKGNKKLPSTIWIFNAGSSRNCPSRKLGLCQIEKKCYADKAEVQYPATFPYRERQEKITKEIKASVFAQAVIDAKARARNKNISFRYNESGDFRNQKQADWFTKVCKELQKNGIPCYGYTARTDLNLSELAKVSTVNCSNTKHNYGKLRKAKKINRFKAVKKYTGKNLKCAGNCRKCSLCQKMKGKTIEVEIH